MHYLPDGVYAVLKGDVTIGYVHGTDASVAFNRAQGLFGQVDHVTSYIVVR